MAGHKIAAQEGPPKARDVIIPLIFFVSSLFYFLQALLPVTVDGYLSRGSDNGPCPLLRVGGTWKVGGLPTDVRLEGFESTCALRHFGEYVSGGNRKLLAIGDSQVRFLVQDIAVEMFGCVGFKWVSPYTCSYDPSLPLKGPCFQLVSYSCEKRQHADLHLRDFDRNLSLDFLWTVSAEEITGAGVRGALQDASYDAVMMSLGLWDVEVKKEVSNPLSLPHHCSWMATFAADSLKQAALTNPRLERSLVFFTPPYPEPYHGNMLRFPANSLSLMNDCSRVAVEDLAGLHFFNATPLFLSPPPVMDALTALARRTDNEAGMLLTMDGYHPRESVRKVFLHHLFHYFASAL